jgi:hypothetical protein
MDGLLEKVEAVWSIHHTTVQDGIDGLGHGPLQRVKAQPDCTHFMIMYFGYESEQPRAVGFSICIPPAIFEAPFSLWKDFVFRAARIRYTISLDFLGFAVPGANTDTPTPDEWTDRDILKKKSVFGHNLTVSFAPDTREALRDRAPTPLNRPWAFSRLFR